MAKEEVKLKVKDKILTPEGKLIYLSAQDFNALTEEEQEALDEVLVEQGKDKYKYKDKMKALFPREFISKPLTWRLR